MHRNAMTRRGFLASSFAAGVVLTACDARRGPPRPREADSTFFATANVQPFSPCDTRSDGDLWASCWADDDCLYAANGDGRGFALDQPEEAVVINRIEGTPETGLTGQRLAAGERIAPIWADPRQYNQKPTGMVAVPNEWLGHDELYAAVQDLHRSPCPACFNDAPNATISRSSDYGRTWQPTAEPMFDEHRFTTIFFLDYGKSYRDVRVLGPEGACYVYAYGLDWNWRDPTKPSDPTPTELYLARVPRDRIQDRSAWQFYAGLRGGGRPGWSRRMADREPVLHDAGTVYPKLFAGGRPTGDIARDVGVLSQGGVVYNKPLRRYLYTSWTWYTFEFYEAPQPWGPWKLFYRADFGATPWYGESTDPRAAGPKEGGYATAIPSKFISPDGRTMWVQSNSFERWNYASGQPNYHFSLRRLTVQPFLHSTASNQPDEKKNLARTGVGVTPIVKSAHHGRPWVLSDGVEHGPAESSLDGEPKKLDFWGYTFACSYRFDQLEYTTGRMFPDGGWFARDGGGLWVEVRRNFRWRAVRKLSISPRYPYDSSAGPYQKYTLRFEPTEGDGIRLIGRPGGSKHFTTVAELGAFYRGG